MFQTLLEALVLLLAEEISLSLALEMLRQVLAWGKMRSLVAVETLLLLLTERETPLSLNEMESPQRSTWVRMPLVEEVAVVEETLR